MITPINLHVDNKGAIYLAENEYACQRTKHIDVKYHFMRQHVETGLVKLNLVASADNMADIFTKNVDAKTFQRHICKFMELCEWKAVSK